MIGRTGGSAGGAAALVLMLAVPGVAQAPQQQFGGAIAALEGRGWTGAMARFEAVDAQAKDAPASLARARIREAEAMLRLERRPEAYRALRAGLADLPDSPDLLEDRALGRLMLAELYERELLYGDALPLFQAAEAGAPTTALKLRALRGIVQTSMFHDGALALAAADRAVQLAGARDGSGPRTQAGFEGLRARVLLNLGRVAEARDALGRANAALGGFNRRVDVDSITVRADTALAALKAGDQVAARAALAYTGAGRVATAEVFYPEEMMLPPCGAWTGLSPEDQIVLQVAIGEDGRPGLVTPVHASRQGAPVMVAAGFVRHWRWSPERLAGVGPIFRLFARIEVRCSRREDEAPMARMESEFQEWLRSRGVETVRRPASLEELGSIRRRLAEVEAQQGPEAIQVVPLLISLALADHSSIAEAREATARAARVARANRAPPAALAYPEAALALLHFREAQLSSPQPRFHVDAFARDPIFAADPRGAAAVRLFLLWTVGAENMTQVRAGITEVSEDSRLASDDPWRRMAQRWLVRDDLSAGREVGREAAQAVWGPVPPCRHGFAPRAISSSEAEGSFPDEALRWGFEGWVTLEHDVLPDGSRTGVRATAAYPPFVFAEAAERLGARLRHVPSTDGCYAGRQRIVFRITR